MSARRPVSRASGLPVEGTSRGREESLRTLTACEAVEVLSHQLEIERGERARVQTRELLITVALLGAVFGGSYAVVRHFKVNNIRKLSPMRKKRRRRR